MKEEKVRLAIRRPKLYILKGGLEDHCVFISWTAWFYYNDIVRGTTWTH